MDRRKDDTRLSAIYDMLSDDIKPQLTKIHDAIYGNGDLGLKTKVALNRQSVARMWYFVGAISLLIVGTAIKVVAF